jgi:putative transposase
VVCRIRRIRKKLKIRCKQVRKFKATTNSKHKLPVAENLLEQKFEAQAPDEIWLYCAARKDLFNGEIVGYAMGLRITKDLVIESLSMAATLKETAGWSYPSFRQGYSVLLKGLYKSP